MCLLRSMSVSMCQTCKRGLRTYIQKHTYSTCLCSDTPPPFYTSSKVFVPFHRSVPSCSEPSEGGLAQAENHRESLKISRLSVSQPAQKEEWSKTAAFPLLISSIDCVNGCHWRWRDRQAAFVRSSEQSCGITLSPTFSWCEAKGYTRMQTMQNV